MLSIGRLPRKISPATPVIAVLVLAVAVVASVPASAQRADEMLSRIRPHLAAVDKGLDEIEGDLTRIERQARIAPSDDRIEAAMDRVAKSGSDALQLLIDGARGPDKAKIAATYPQAFSEFERAAQGFRDRATKITDRILAIQKGIVEGQVVVNLEVFDKTTARERVEFMKVLNPQAKEIYRKMSPAKFAGLDFQLQRLAMGLGSAVKDACAPDANALIAAVCVSLCASTGGAACVECVAAAVAGGATTTYLYFKNGYESCLRSCCRCRWYKPWCCACRAGCFLAWAAFIA